ncbi:MAG: KdsC family phosphatase [Myxococcota bacterium]
MGKAPEAVRARAAAIRMLVLDVDGVMTDGTLWYGPGGEHLKPFHVRDGFGIKLLRHAGIEVAVLSGRRSPPLERRLADLGIARAILGRDDKLPALGELLAAVGVPEAEVAHVGDDVLDLPVMRRVGLGITVSDAHARVRGEADWITEAPGGGGAVREVAEGLLDARGLLDEAYRALLARVGAEPEEG